MRDAADTKILSSIQARTVAESIDLQSVSARARVRVRARAKGARVKVGG
jgi:hypothetical protein